jgi:hypothetical protein
MYSDDQLFRKWFKFYRIEIESVQLSQMRFSWVDDLSESFDNVKLILLHGVVLVPRLKDGRRQIALDYSDAHV